MINKNNYEAYAIDLLDGNLSPELEAQLLLFFAQHPDLKAEFEELSEGLDAFEATPPPTFKGSHLMQPDALPSDRDHMLAQYLEGQLSPEAGAEVFRKISQDANWAEAWEYMQLTRIPSEKKQFTGAAPLLIPEALTAQQASWLAAADKPALQGEASEVHMLRTHIVTPDLSVVYPHKRGLKRGVVIPLALRWIGSAAAVAILLIGLLPLLPTSDNAPALAALNRSATAFDLNYPVQNQNSTATPSGHVLSSAGSTKPQDGINLVDMSTPSEQGRHASYAFARSLKPAPLANKATSAEFAYAAPSTTVPTPTRTSPEQFVYTPAAELVASKLKSRLWGSQNYPQENYVVALVEKTSDNLARKRGVELEREEKEGKRKGFRLRIGAFELVRSRRK